MFISTEMNMKFFKNTEIETYSWIANDLLKQAFETARNRNSVPISNRRLINQHHSAHLLAVNHQSRLTWGEAISEQLSEHFCLPGSVDHNQPIFFITLCDVGCATSVDDTDPDIAGLKSHLRAGLRGLSYFGAIEPAYYTNVQKGARVKRKRCVFWHLHALVWGITAQQLKDLVAKLEASGRYRSISETLPGAKGEEIKQGDLARMTGYIFKPPANAYRLSRREIVRQGLPLFYFKQGKSPLRPGERVRLFHTMKNLCLDELALAGGEGVGLLASAKNAAWDASGFSRIVAAQRAFKRAQNPTTALTSNMN
jgi:hypothetical protein